MSNFENTAFQMEVRLDGPTKVRECEEDVEVDVIELTKSNDVRAAGEEDPDATEYSSSFANTTSGNDNCSGMSDAEVESQLYGDNGLASAFDGFCSVFPLRKKKLTSHWRNFIHPLMWRCKWTELRIKEFESQALKYTKHIVTYDQRKQMALDQSTLEDCGTRSLPFTFQSHRKRAMKRRRRKKVEDMTDITSYMSQHNLFSYHEKKRSDVDGTSMADDFGNPVLTEPNTPGHDEFGVNDDWPFFEDNSFPEQILRKIEIVYSRIHKMKAQLEVVMSKNAGKFSSYENLNHLVTCNAQTSSVPSPTFSACNGDAISVEDLCITQHISEYDTGDFVMPESAVSSYGEAIPIPDIIESTVGLLSSVDVTQHQPQFGDSCEDIVDNILMQDQSAELEMNTLEKNLNQPINKNEEPEKSGEEESTNPCIPTLEPDTISKTAMPQEQSTLKSCLASDFHFPKNKRKRGERKAGSANWSRQRPGEPDSQ